MKKFFTGLLVLIAFAFFVPNVFAVELTENLTLEDDTTECFRVLSGSNITIDLNGKNITCATDDAIYVENGAKLTIKGEGYVESTKSSHAALYNNGEVVLNGGAFKCDDKTTHYYAVLNHGVMTINEGASVFQTNYDNSASLIDNGYYDFTDPNERLGYVTTVGNEQPTLTINGGHFDGGRNTVKNDDNAVLVINDGYFENNVQVAVMNWNVATINGGTFEVPTGNDKTTLFLGSYGADSVDKGIIEINGGRFNGEYIVEFMTGQTNGASLTITDGIFNSSVGFVNTVNRPGLDAITTHSITGGVFTDVNITPDEGYSLVPIGTDYNNDGVDDVLVSEVQLIPPVEVALKVGETYNAELSSDIMNYGTWTSTDSEVASVTKGVITANKKGTATVQVKFGTDVRKYNVTVTRNQVTKPTLSGTYTYTGEEQTVTINGFDQTKMSVTGNNGTNANSYVAHVGLLDTVTYEWADGSDVYVDLEWAINKAKVTKPTLVTNKYGYTGETVTPEVTGYDEALMTASGDTTGVNVGEYTLTYALKDSANYEWADETTEDVTLTWNVTKAQVAKPTLVTTKYAYTGEAITPEVTGYIDTLMTASGDTTGVDYGEYSLVYALKDTTNYEWADETTTNVTLVWNITKVQVTKPTLEVNEFDYTGSEITPVVTGYIDTLMTMSGDTTKTAIGEYEIVVSLKNTNNYEWADGTQTDVKLAWSVTKAKLVKPTLVKTSYAFTGKEIEAELENFNETLMTKAGMPVGSPVGKYTIRISLKDTDTYTWSDGTTDTLELVWSITFGVPELKASSTYNSVKLTWTEVDGADGYQVYRCNSENKSCTKLKTTSDLTYTEKKLKFNKKYYYKVRAYRTEDGVRQYGKYTDLISKKTALAKPKVTASTNRYKNVLVEWNKVSGASRYYVYRCDKDGKNCKNVGFTYDTDFINTNGKEGVEYTYKVRAYRGGVYGGYSEGVIGLRLVDEITYKVKNTAYKTNTITIEKVDTATKYYIYRATSKNGKYTKIKTVNATGENIVYEDKNVSFNKKYYYKIRINNGVNTSAYSGVKNVTTNKVGVPAFEVETEMSYATINITKVSGATGYQIMYSADGEDFETLVKTTDLSYDKKLADGKHYIKVRAYRKSGSTYYYGSYSAVKEVNISTEK